MRLVSAIVPPPEVVDHLATWLAGHMGDLPPELRWTPVDQWHVTFGFFGDGDDPVRRGKWLRRRADGRPAPRLRIAGAGTFPGVLWAGVRTDDERVLAQLAKAAGAGRRGFRPHLTLARWRSGKPDEAAMVEPFEGYSGPWFTPDVLLLMRSELGPDRPTYTTVERLPLAHT
jgi:2'-5' RNA ligase